MSLPSVSSLAALLLIPCVLAPALSTQTGEPSVDERPFLEAAAEKLNAYATVCFKNGYPRKAKETWLEVIAEYDADDEVARKALGYTKMGTVWQPDPNFEFPEQDNPNAAVARSLEKRWESLARDLGKGHRELALKLQEAGKEERARYHFDRALRFTPEDDQAQAAMGVRNYEGFSGTELEITLLKRSRVMDRAITRLTEEEYDVEEVPGTEGHPYLAKGGTGYQGVKSENFTIWGTWEQDVLREAAANAERALAFCEVAFEGYEGFPPKQGLVRHMAFFEDRDEWASTVRANASLLGDSNVDFVLANTSACTLGGQHAIRLAGMEHVDNVHDLTVRWVVQGYSGLRSDALVEGIGHAVVGMFFGRNLTFTVGQERQRGTVAGGRKQQKLLLPDMETWRELATENAWQRSGTTHSAELPLLQAASFPTDGRIKAWSFCDYLLRRDPALLLELDRTASKSRNPFDVRANFQEATGVSLDALEEGWRQFWTEDTPLQRAIRNKVTPLESVSREAPKWLAEFNDMRSRYGISEVGWSATLSTDCRMHVEYLKKNRGERDPAEVHTQVPGKDGFTNEGRSFAEKALVATGSRNPGKAMEDWMSIPGYRDAVLNRNIDTVGLYVDGSIMVMDAHRGRKPTTTATMAMWPYASQRGNKAREPVPSSVEVGLLGAEVEKLLKEHGHGRAREIGYPISLHFYSADAGNVTCSMWARDELVEGVLHDATEGSVRTTSAPGMYVFYPFEPLDRGVELKVVWSHRNGTSEVNFVAQ